MAQKSVHTQAYKLLQARLVAAREAHNLTQAETASALRRPQSYISKVESGERRLDLIEFLALSAVIGLDPSSLIKDLKKSLK